VGTPEATQDERPPLIVFRPSAQELAEHARLLADIEAENKAQCVWRRFEPAVEIVSQV
jgi:DNA polymerase-3 subunit epsilon